MGAVLVGAAGSTQATAPLHPNHLVINEVAANIEGPDAGNEWVELYNPTALPIILDGWVLTDHDSGFGGGDEHLDGQLILPGELLVIELDEVRLGNTGDDLDLIDPDGNIVDSVHYGTKGPLPATEPGETLARWFLLDGEGLADGGQGDWYVEEEPSRGGLNDIGLGL